ncbi:hypothetical protein P43SY_005505 [Pythium insidiosum]|uniref:Bzip transcription factor n=1 Tax=Pythium insidiosum TaxID=114742 RepID=A0AAD5M7Q4_PYTIN|nr:hypothetical protein P43SY_005505 [Pythium insidiosum]
MQPSVPPNAVVSRPKPRARAKRRASRFVWRTRDAENSRLYNLQLDVQSLRQEVESLRSCRELLMARALTSRGGHDGSLMRIIREYFRVFHHGYQAPDDSVAMALTSNADEFVHRVIDDDIVIGRFRGIELMMKQWARYSSSLGPITLTLQSAEVLPTMSSADDPETSEVTISCRATYRLCLSLETIKIIFPHCLARPDIVARLVSRPFEGIGRFDFAFDGMSDRIIRYDFDLDFAAAFTKLLRDPVLVATVLSGALISEECFIGDLSDFRSRESSRVGHTREAAQDGNQRDDQASRYIRPWQMELSQILSTKEEEEEEDAELHHP